MYYNECQFCGLQEVDEIERKIRQRKAESYRKAEDGEDERINPEN